MIDKNFDENVAVVDSVADNTADSSKSSTDENLNGAENSPVVLEHAEISVADNVGSENLSAADENLDHADKSSDLIDDSDDDDAYSSECAITTVDNPFDPLEDLTIGFLLMSKKVITLVRILEELFVCLMKCLTKKLRKKLKERSTKFWLTTFSEFTKR